MYLTGDAILTLTEIVCWTRIQAESGQDLQAIATRKNLECLAGDGVFCWGVGNAPNSAIRHLARARADIDVVFSIMRSRPKVHDISPLSIALWRSFIDTDGREQQLPDHVLITSRGSAEFRLKRNHYALVCRTSVPLTLGDTGPFDPAAYRNVSDVGAPVGSSQVTSLLRRVRLEEASSNYRINLRAKLIGSYWVRLANPVQLTAEKVKRLKACSTLPGMGPVDWREFVADLRKDSGDIVDWTVGIERRLL